MSDCQPNNQSLKRISELFLLLILKLGRKREKGSLIRGSNFKAGGEKLWMLLLNFLLSLTTISLISTDNPIVIDAIIGFPEPG